mgnify:CR=1 FL=1
MRSLRLGIVVALVGVGSACSALGGEDDQDTAAALADDLAAALSDHTLGDVPLADESARAAFTDVVAPLDEVPVSVSVDDVQVVEEEGRADVTLAWRWELSDAAAWQYETSVGLTQGTDGSTWTVAWSPDDLAPDLAEGDTLGLRTLTPVRGDITGAGGAVLVTERPVLRYGLDKTKVEGAQVARSARRIARVLDVDATSYVDALAEAQRLGYAERDPTADVEGHDAAAKIAIIANFAFGAHVVADDVTSEGISRITAGDIAMARKFGYVIKLLGVAERDPQTGAVSVRVHPAMVHVQHPLAAVREAFNAVTVEGEASGALMFYGRGAGGDPTASSVLGDVIDAAVNLKKGTHASLGTFAKAKFA